MGRNSKDRNKICQGLSSRHLYVPYNPFEGEMTNLGTSPSLPSKKPGEVKEDRYPVFAIVFA